MKDWGLLLVVCIAVASTTALITFIAIYLLWLRGVFRRLLEVQQLLQKVTKLLPYAATSPTLLTDESSLGADLGGVLKLKMSVEGKQVAIVELNGRDIVRFEEPVTDAEKKRILDYLKVEGFIPA
jgi:hypothetical protein